MNSSHRRKKLNFKVRKLNMNTNPKGKTEIIEGEKKETGEYYFILSRQAKVKFLDIDNYIEVTLVLADGKDGSEEKKFLWSAGAPLVEGSFQIKKLSLSTIQISFPRIKKNG